LMKSGFDEKPPHSSLNWLGQGDQFHWAFLLPCFPDFFHYQACMRNQTISVATNDRVTKVSWLIGVVWYTHRCPWNLQMSMFKDLFTLQQ
jgi:hypothetical protein